MTLRVVISDNFFPTRPQDRLKSRWMDGNMVARVWVIGKFSPRAGCLICKKTRKMEEINDINQDVEAEGKPHPPHFRRSYLQPSTNGFLQTNPTWLHLKTLLQWLQFTQIQDTLCISGMSIVNRFIVCFIPVILAPNTPPIARLNL